MQRLGETPGAQEVAGENFVHKALTLSLTLHEEVHGHPAVTEIQHLHQRAEGCVRPAPVLFCDKQKIIAIGSRVLAWGKDESPS